MIISRLNGGLGNQMFQYALGRVISKLNNSELYLDLSLYKNQHELNTIRNFELSIFPNIKSTEISLLILNKFTKSNKLKLLLNHFLKLDLKAYPSNWIRENNHQFHPEILKLRGDYLLDGYWQTEKYFKKYRKLILNDFSFPKKISKRNKDIINLIKDKEAVSIHIRRGDYVSNKLTNSYHGVCSPNYYKKAILLIKNKIKKPSFIIFSDNINWCKKNLLVPKKSLFIDHNTEKKSFEDMRLMSLCKHNIIANSSFSWWGAWLNQNKNKIIIAPDPWFKNKEAKKRETVPSHWIKIKS